MLYFRMKVLIATHNPAKLLRYQRLLAVFPNVELVSLTDLGITTKVDEPFETAKENAVYKAEEYSKISGLPTLSVDESVMTNFLPDNEQPGVYVRRFADKTHEMTDLEALEIWRKVIQENPHEDQQFIWDYSIAFFNPVTKESKYCKVVNIARVAKEFSKKVIPGYPMSSFMIYQGTSKPAADLAESEAIEADREIFHNFIEEFGILFS